MAEIQPYDSGNDIDEELKTPVWVKVFAALGILFVVVFIILHLTGNSLGGNHGRMRYSSPPANTR